MQLVKVAKVAKKAARRELNYTKHNGISQEQNQTLACKFHQSIRSHNKLLGKIKMSFKHLAVLETPVSWRVSK